MIWFRIFALALLLMLGAFACGADKVLPSIDSPADLSDGGGLSNQTGDTVTRFEDTAVNVAVDVAPPKSCDEQEECDDGASCTTDLCNDEGICTHVVADGMCFVDGQCVEEGDQPANNACQICKPDSMNNYWSTRHNQSCDDGDPCTEESYCNKDSCEGVAMESCCGNGVVEAGETCDGDCSEACEETDACTLYSFKGSAETCDALCLTEPVTTCASDDGCCPLACAPNEDNDCPTVCGNGVMEPGELCDGNCPAGCDDGDPCTKDTLVGSPATCDSHCESEAITECISGDGCCTGSCTTEVDSDCPCEVDIVVQCVDEPPGVFAVYQITANASPGYLFWTHPPGTELLKNWCLNDSQNLMPIYVSSGCIHATYETGTCLLPEGASPQKCEATKCFDCGPDCDDDVVEGCVSNDGCCPDGCNIALDNDCTAQCGNGYVDEGEVCDGDCPSSCDDGNACTVDLVAGSSSSCDAVCVSEPLQACIPDDGCCPFDCSYSTDNDCPETCGNGTLDAGEICEGDCPTSCDDGDPCTDDTLLGSPSTCDSQCEFTPKSECVSGDGCCTGNCGQEGDSDCPCEINIEIECVDNQSAKYWVTVNAPVGHLYYGVEGQILVNWCLNDTQQWIDINLSQGCIHATYETGNCVLPPGAVEKSCETTECFDCTGN